MNRVIAGVAALLLGTAATVAVGQSPGSVESELIYAQEYMDAGKWDYAMWRYEDILRLDPDNAEAQAGYAKAKAAYDAKKAKQEAQARAFSSTARTRSGSTPIPSRSLSGRPAARQSKPVSKAQAFCDAQFGSCNAIYRSIAACAPKRAMCYTQNGIK